MDSLKGTDKPEIKVTVNTVVKKLPDNAFEVTLDIKTEGKKFLRTAVIEFSSFEIAKNFFYSKEYQAAHNILKDTVVRHHQIVEGI